MSWHLAISNGIKGLLNLYGCPFGALVEFLPASLIQKETTSKMAPNTIPGISIGYYEDINGLRKD